MTKYLPTLAAAAVDVLTSADPHQKVSKTYELAGNWRESDLALGQCRPPDRPSRPLLPRLCAPREMPKRSTGPKGRIALVHALAHIELNAIDLAWYIVARFTSEDLPPTFYDNWVTIAEEEAKHFEALQKLLVSWSTNYGDLPAHDGLWEAANATKDFLLARLALIPMTLEARGIDTTPTLVKRLRQAGDHQTANILDIIYEDEIGHLSIGVKWFKYLCKRYEQTPETEYRYLINRYFKGILKPPFNTEARAKAGMTLHYLRP